MDPLICEMNQGRVIHQGIHRWHTNKTVPCRTCQYQPSQLHCIYCHLCIGRMKDNDNNTHNKTKTQQSTTVLDSQVLPSAPYNSYRHNWFNSVTNTAEFLLPYTHHHLLGLIPNREGWICHDGEIYCKVPFTGTLSGNK